MASIKVRALKATCQAVASDLLQSGSVTADAVRAVAPGGSDNPARDGAAWLRFYGQLQLLRGRAQGSGGIAAATAESSPEVRAADALALAAMAEQPSAVGSAPELSVYPKSFATLLYCHAREILVGQLTRVVAMAKLPKAPSPIVSALEESVLELGYQARLLAWIATSEGPQLPFPDQTPRPELPPYVVDLSALVILDINRHFASVNWSGLKAMEALITPPEEDDGAPSKRLAWSPFFGSLSLELATSPTELLRNRSLASVLASTQLAASSRREAMADVKARAEREREQRQNASES